MALGNTPRLLVAHRDGPLDQACNHPFWGPPAVTCPLEKRGANTVWDIEANRARTTLCEARHARIPALCADGALGASGRTLVLDAKGILSLAL